MRNIAHNILLFQLWLMLLLLSLLLSSLLVFMFMFIYLVVCVVICVVVASVDAETLTFICIYSHSHVNVLIHQDFPSPGSYSK